MGPKDFRKPLQPLEDFSGSDHLKEICEVAFFASFLQGYWESNLLTYQKAEFPHLFLCSLPACLDLDANGTTEKSSSSLQFGEAPPSPPPPPPATPPPPQPKPRSPRRAPSPPRQKLQYFPWASSRQRGRSRGQRAALGRGQMFEDPAVMRIIEGRPSLKVTKMNLCVVRKLH